MLRAFFTLLGLLSVLPAFGETLSVRLMLREPGEDPTAIVMAAPPFQAELGSPAQFRIGRELAVRMDDQVRPVFGNIFEYALDGVEAELRIERIDERLAYRIKLSIYEQHAALVDSSTIVLNASHSYASGIAEPGQPARVEVRGADGKPLILVLTLSAPN